MDIHETAFIAEGAVVIGDVTVKEDVGIWYHTTIRGDRTSITIGKGSNIQDNTVLHVDTLQPVVIGQYVTVGHSAIVHGCRIGDNSLIGMGAILMNGSEIGKNCIIGAGALVTQNTIIADNSLVLGNPGKVIRSVTDEEITRSIKNAVRYISEAKEHKKMLPQSKG